MVLEQLNCENSQNLKSSCNRTSHFKLIKNGYILGHQMLSKLGLQLITLATKKRVAQSTPVH